MTTTIPHHMLILQKRVRRLYSLSLQVLRGFMGFEANRQNSTYANMSMKVRVARLTCGVYEMRDPERSRASY